VAPWTSLAPCAAADIFAAVPQFRSATAELIFSGSRRRASAARPDALGLLAASGRHRPARRPNPCDRLRSTQSLRRGLSGFGDEWPPSRPPSTQAKPSRRVPGRQGRTSGRALHLGALGQARSTVCGSTADGMALGRGAACSERATRNGDHGKSAATSGQQDRSDFCPNSKTPTGVSAGGRCSKPGERLGGQGRGRTADLPIFSRTLVPTELPGPAAPWCTRTWHVAVLTGLEPATSALTGRRALQLLHRTLLRALLTTCSDRGRLVPPTGFEPVLPP
jgi:hypothetical protein